MVNRKQVVVLHNLEIVKVADKGLGMAYSEGKVIFVERSVPGDVVDVQLFKNKKNFAMGFPVHVHRLSERRAEPYCEHFGVCGGCRWQNLPYDAELEYKTQLVADALHRVAGIRGAEVQPALGAPATTLYRNKLEYTFANRRWLSQEDFASGKDAASDILGYHIPGYFDKVLPIAHCHLQPEPSNAIRLFCARRARELNMPFFDLNSQTGQLRNLLIRNNRRGEFMVILVLSEHNAQSETLLQDLMAEFPAVHSLFCAVNTKRNSSLEGVPLLHIAGADHLVEYLGGVRYRIGPRSFFQTNPQQAEVLVNKVRELAEIQPDDRVYDLYTGLGSLALFIADQCREVLGLEWVEDAVADARQNALDNGMANCHFFSGDMARLLTPGFMEQHGRPDVILTDPPRAGMTDAVNRCLLASGARRIVYVSCNPVSQARDLEQLLEGYRISLLQPVDLFPRTYHIENIAVLDKL
jgi:23S rRNA (uracil1939-C5)-methyltransferase